MADRVRVDQCVATAVKILIIAICMVLFYKLKTHRAFLSKELRYTMQNIIIKKISNLLAAAYLVYMPVIISSSSLTEHQLSLFHTCLLSLRCK